MVNVSWNGSIHNDEYDNDNENNNKTDNSGNYGDDNDALDDTNSVFT